MTRPIEAGILALALCSAAIDGAVGQTPPLPPTQATPKLTEGEAWLIARIFPQAGQKVSALRDNLNRLYAQSSYIGGGITAKDHEIAAVAVQARARAGLLIQMLTHDLDGDGKVTRQEVEMSLGPQIHQPLRSGVESVMPTAEQVQRLKQQHVGRVMAADTNNDGVLTYEEMVASAQRQAAGSAGNRTTLLMALTGQFVPLSLDADGDGTVSIAEYTAAVDRVVARIDTDGDGTVSAAEATAFQAAAAEARRAQQASRLQMQRTRELEQLRARCALPPIPEGARLLIVGGYQATAVSSVSIGGDDVEVGVARLDIEPGSEPLAIVVTSYEATIWQLTGATGRVARFIVSSRVGSGGRPRVGVSGIPTARVSFAAATDCLPLMTKAAPGLIEQIEGVVGRKADKTHAAYDVGHLRLPSGQHEPRARHPAARMLPTSGASQTMWGEMLRFAPAGLVDLKPADVVAALPVRRFEVLPQQAGLAQLIEEGALVVEAGTPTVPAGGTRLRITRKMTFPAGLNGAHAVTFILPKGVPMPDGHPGHSRILDADTGEVVKGR